MTALEILRFGLARHREVDCGGLLLGLSGYNARTCGGGKRYARKVLGLVAKFWKLIETRREPNS